MSVYSKQNPSYQIPSIQGDVKKARKKRTLADYEFVIDETNPFKSCDLGAGAYGRVKRVREKATGKQFAMKIMSKETIFRYSSKENLKREVSIQKSIRHPHVIRLYHYFEDNENVYIVLELAENGSLFDYIRKRKCSENEAFVFFFQTALGLDYLHKKKIIHRDLKPENLLIDKNGNVKLCDFGWSAETQNKRITFCGTVDYMAPEIIKNQSYDHRVDIWSLGILLFELLHGYPPFQGKTDQEKSHNIKINALINFDPSLSLEVCDLIQKLLKSRPSERLTMENIFKHPWMKKYEHIYNINILSYVKEQDFGLGEESSSDEASRKINEGSIDNKVFERNSEPISQKTSNSLASLTASDQKQEFLEKLDSVRKSEQIRSTDNLSTGGSETNSGVNLNYGAYPQVIKYDSDIQKKDFYFDHGFYSQPKSDFNAKIQQEKVNPWLDQKLQGNSSDLYRYGRNLQSNLSFDTSNRRFLSGDRLLEPNYRSSEKEQLQPQYSLTFERDSRQKNSQTLTTMFQRNKEIEKKFERKRPNFFKRFLMDLGCITRDHKVNND